MALQLYRLRLLLVLAAVIGAGGWVFNPSGKPAGGFVWDRYQTQKVDEREAAIARHNYCPTGGCVIRLEEVKLQPVETTPGSTLILTTKYTILTPENLPIPINLSREINFHGKSLGRVKAMEASAKNGTYVQDVHITLPTDAAPGVYTLITRVSTGYGMDQKSLEFIVK